MRSSHSILILGLLLISICVQSQTRHRVNNTGVSAPFTTLDAAVAAAVDGDILILDHSDTPYTLSSDMSKRLIIYGPGYYLEDNDSTQADIRTATISSINYVSGSENSNVSGIIFDNVSIEADDIQIYRCRLDGPLIIGAAGAVDGVFINQCFMEASESILVDIVNATNLVFMNNFCNNLDAAGTFNFRFQDGNGLILNNVFYGTPDNIFKNATVQNNYFEKSEFNTGTSSNLVVSHNISEGIFLNTEWGEGDVNKYEQPPDSVFCLLLLDGVTRDGKYQLRNPGSNALGAGADGLDIGMYGGSDPYIKSGMPKIPSVWFYNGSGSGTQGGGTTVVVKTKSHK